MKGGGQAHEGHYLKDPAYKCQQIYRGRQGNELDGTADVVPGEDVGVNGRG